jgi:hypothetical protein
MNNKRFFLVHFIKSLQNLKIFEKKGCKYSMNSEFVICFFIFKNISKR